MSEKFNLNWIEFSEHLQLMVRDLYQEGKYSDVTLVSDDQTQFKAHKIVLSACSPVLKKIIDNDPSQQTRISLSDVQSYEMESILEFMYLGDGTFYYERLEEFMKVAKYLEVKEISKGMENPNDMKEIAMDDEENKTKGKDHNGEPSKEESVNSTETDYDIKLEPTLTLEPKVTSLEENVSTETEYKGTHEVGVSLKSTKSKRGKKKHRTQNAEKSSNKLKQIQTRNEVNKYPCKQCGKLFTQQFYLKTHIQSKHEGIKYPCNQCDYQAPLKDTLKEHIESKHEGIKYFCDQCDYQSTNKCTLRKHFKTKHEGIMYPCNQCDKQYQNQFNLRAHIKNVHEAIKYQCDQCEHQATQLHNLKTHIKLRHG